ncbi:MAG: DUF2092 domain-containing protein [Elainella sp.]
MVIRQSIKIVGLVVLSAVLATLPLQAQTNAPTIDPYADELLRKMGETLQSSQDFMFKAETTVDAVSETGQKIQYSGITTVSVRRPDGLQADSVGDRGSRSFWYDGQSITLLDRTQNVYATVPAPSEIDQAVDYAVEQFSLSTPLVDLVFSDPYAILSENIQTGRYLGLHRVLDKQCHHLAFTQQNIDWQIWLAAGSRPLPCKVVITYKNKPGSPQYTALLTQ